jgi:drug/metabolite transporter (DMT)-like permease
MTLQPTLLLPLACALVYVLGALAVKRAAAFGVGVWRTSFVSNWAMAGLFLPGWFGSGGHVHPLADYGQPALTAALFLAGQALMFLALSRGDVSVITPVMGTKVIMVALCTSLLRVGTIPLKWWVGAALSTTAILLLHLGEKSNHRHVRTTVLLALGSAAAFSIGDVLLQKWLPGWGAAHFFPPMFLMVGLLSLAFIPYFHAPLSALKADAWRWVGPGALLMALNNAGVVLAIGLVGSATAVNIVYSVRGLFSVLAVWLVGHWFGSAERHLGGPVLRLRFVGATLMVAAVALVLL